MVRVFASQASRRSSQELNDLYERWGIRREIEMSVEVLHTCEKLPSDYAIESYASDSNKSRIVLMFLGERRNLIEAMIRKVDARSIERGLNRRERKAPKRKYIDILNRIERLQMKIKKGLYSNMSHPEDFEECQHESFRAAKALIQDGSLVIRRDDNGMDVSFNIEITRHDRYNISVDVDS